MNKSKVQKGSAIVYALLIMVGILALLPIMILVVKTSSKEAEKQLHYVAQAENIAKTGLSEAVSWFQSNPRQPVYSGVSPNFLPDHFYPDDAFIPKAALDGTINETIGLVKEFPLMAGNTSYAVWGRYEVKRQAVDNWDDSNHAAIPGLTDSHAVHDITSQRFHSGLTIESTGMGLAWYIESLGIVYRKKNSSLNYNEAPNEIVGRARVSTEIIRLALRIPNAAICVNWGGSAALKTVKIQSEAIIQGGSSGYAIMRSAGESASMEGGTLEPAGNEALLADFALTCNSVFGVDKATLQNIAVTEGQLVSKTDDLDEDPYTHKTKPLSGITYINCPPSPNNTATFDSNHPLSGGYLLFVDGNLKVSAGGGGLFSGIIYVYGTIEIEDGLFSGTLISYHEANYSQGVTVNGTNVPGNVYISYDPEQHRQAQKKLNQYREDKSSYHLFSITD